MKKRYHFTLSYTLLPILLLLVLVPVEYMSIQNQSLRTQDIGITVILLIVIFLSLSLDHCAITNEEFYRTSYFFFTKKMRIHDISEVAFRPTWIVTPEARTLVVFSKAGKKITMTDMGYSRPVLADAVRTLLKINPSIQLDEQSRLLIK